MHGPRGSRDPPVSSPRATFDRCAGALRTAFAFSLPLPVVRIGSQRGHGILPARGPACVAPCDAPPTEHPSMRPTDDCFPNSRLRAPVLAGSQCVTRAFARAGAARLWGQAAWLGEGVVTSTDPPRRRSAFPLGRARAGRLVPRARHAAEPPASLSQPPLRFSLGCFHAFAWALPSGDRRARFPPRRVTGAGSFERRRLSSIGVISRQPGLRPT